MRTSLTPLLAVLLLVTAGCGRKQLDHIGKLTGKSYENQFFGLTMQLPDAWHVLSDETNQHLKDAGREAIAGDDRRMNAQMKAAEKSTSMVFSIAEYEVGTPGVLNPILICMVERVTHAPGIKTAKDYLLALKTTLERSNQQAKIVETGKAEKFGDAEFMTAVVQMTSANIPISQDYRVIFKDGYVLAFICTHFDEESDKKLKDILAGIKKL